MKLKGPLARQTLAKKLGVKLEALRYQERVGGFSPIQKNDETGRPIVMYPDSEIKKVFEFFQARDMINKTDAAHVR